MRDFHNLSAMSSSDYEYVLAEVNKKLCKFDSSLINSFKARCSLKAQILFVQQPIDVFFLSALQLLLAIQLFGANLDDYLHLLLPPIVKLFDAPDVPLQTRKSVYSPTCSSFPCCIFALWNFA